MSVARKQQTPGRDRRHKNLYYTSHIINHILVLYICIVLLSTFGTGQLLINKLYVSFFLFHTFHGRHTCGNITTYSRRYIPHVSSHRTPDTDCHPGLPSQRTSSFPSYKASRQDSWRRFLHACNLSISEQTSL